MSLLVLSASDVDAITNDFSPIDLQLLMARVFAALSALSTSAGANAHQGLEMPHRTTISTQDFTALFMPARFSPPPATSNIIPNLGEYEPQLLSEGTSIKVVSVPRLPDPRGLPATTLVLDSATGSVKAVVNARKLTALRNAAGSLLSTNLVGSRYPRHIVAFGAGRQIEAHLDLYVRFFHGVEKCTIVNRSTNARAETLAHSLRQRFQHVKFTLISSEDGRTSPNSPRNNVSSTPPDVESAVRFADVIISATSATIPLFPSHWVRSGTHLILIGSYTPDMHEVGSELILRAVAAPSSQLQGSRAEGKPSQILMVDSKAACLREAGELIAAGINPEQMAEIGRLVPTYPTGELNFDALTQILESSVLIHHDNGEQSTDGKDDFEGPVTIFKSVGVGLQDVAIACAVVRKAEMRNVGLTIPDYDNET